ncbi:MAG: LPP20 family lipoprotein [Candidatus Cloacimonadota bacterium]
MKKLLCLLLPLILLGACALNKRPDWVSSQMADPAYYSSVVAVPKQIADYREQARANALRDISTQIFVNIRSELETREQENAGYVFTSLSGSIQSSTNALLEEVELYQFHEDRKYYYALYRLSKLHYRQQREARKTVALEQAIQSVERFDRSTTDIASGIGDLLFAIELLEPFADLDLRVQLEGRAQNLYTAALSRLRDLPAKLNPSWEETSGSVTALQALDLSQRGKLLYQKSASEQYCCQNFPVQISFSRGDGVFSADRFTNNAGEAELHLNRINSLESRQEIVLTIDKDYFFSRVSSPSLMQSINQLEFGRARYFLEVGRPKLYLEFDSGSPDDRQNAQRLQGKLLELDLDAVERPTLADYRMQIRISIRQGTYISAVQVYSSSSDIQINLIDQNSGQTVQSLSYPNIKGTGTTQSMADYRARQNAVRIINDELLYRILSQSVLAP